MNGLEDEHIREYGREKEYVLRHLKQKVTNSNWHSSDILLASTPSEGAN